MDEDSPTERKRRRTFNAASTHSGPLVVQESRHLARPPAVAAVAAADGAFVSRLGTFIRTACGEAAAHWPQLGGE